MATAKAYIEQSIMTTRDEFSTLNETVEKIRLAQELDELEYQQHVTEYRDFVAVVNSNTNQTATTIQQIISVCNHNAVECNKLNGHVFFLDETINDNREIYDADMTRINKQISEMKKRIEKLSKIITFLISFIIISATALIGASIPTITKIIEITTQLG